MKNASPLGSLFGRILLAALFLLSGLNKIPNFKTTADGLIEEHVPGADVALVGGLRGADLLLGGAVALEIIGSLSILIGLKARFGALLLLIFLAPVTYFFHDFWTFEDQARQQTEMINFLKNVAIAGGLLMILAMGPGALSIDHWLPKRAKTE
jgi:putative oxidoreductase